LIVLYIFYHETVGNVKDYSRRNIEIEREWNLQWREWNCGNEIDTIWRNNEIWRKLLSEKIMSNTNLITWKYEKHRHMFGATTWNYTITIFIHLTSLLQLTYTPIFFPIFFTKTIYAYFLSSSINLDQNYTGNLT